MYFRGVIFFCKKIATIAKQFRYDIVFENHLDYEKDIHLISFQHFINSRLRSSRIYLSSVDTLDGTVEFQHVGRCTAPVCAM